MYSSKTLLNAGTRNNINTGSLVVNRKPVVPVKVPVNRSIADDIVLKK